MSLRTGDQGRASTGVPAFCRLKPTLILLLAGSLIGLCASIAAAAEGGPDRRLQDLRKQVDQAIDAVKAGDMQLARKRYREFDEGWERIEDGVRAKSRDSYRKIEQSMANVKNRLIRPDKPNSRAALSALEQLNATIGAALPALK